MSAAKGPNGLLGFAQFSILSGATTASNSTISDIERTIPGFGFVQDLFSSWFALDVTKIFVISTLFVTLFGALKDLQGVASKLRWYFTKLFTASISIASNDRLNREIINWIGSNVLTKQKTRVLTARSEIIENDAYSWHRRKTERNELYEKRVPIQFLPTFGTTWFFYERTIFLVRRISSRSHYSANNNIPEEYTDAPEGNEPLVILCLGTSVEPIKKFLEACRDFAEKEREAFITIRASKNEYHSESWDTTILRPIRPLETVHFDEKEKKELVADIRNYLDPKTRKFYTSRGIPYRRGLLLYGPAGTGKTSLSLALAGKFGLELYLVHLPSVREDSELTKMFTSLPPRCIVLLEDIDAVGAKRKPTAGSKDSDEDADSDDEDELMSSGRGTTRCTLSGLLNVLDGVASQEGRIVLMTSNFAEKLDKALVRPGRIDKKIYLGPISQRSAELMFLRMYTPDSTLDLPMDFGLQDGELEKLALKFSSRIVDNTFTPAQLQGYLLNYRSFPAAAAEEVGDWVVEEMKKMDEQKAREKKAKEWRKQKKRDRLLKALATVEAAEEDTSKDVDKISTSNSKEEIASTNVESGSDAGSFDKIEKENTDDAPSTQATKE